MSKAKGKYTSIAPNYLSNIVSPAKNHSFAIQLQEPTNDRMNPIKSSIGFSLLHDDQYLNEQSLPKQVEIANDKDQNNEEIIVNNQVHEKVIDQNYSKEDQFDCLLHQNDINSLDFIATLLRLQKPKSGKALAKPDDESKSDIREIIDLCEEPKGSRLVSNERAYTSNITANCNLDSFLNDITPRKKGFEAQVHSGEKKGLSMKDLIEITNKRKKHLNGTNCKEKGCLLNVNNGLQNSNSDLKQGHSKPKNSSKRKRSKRQNSTGSVRYDEINPSLSHLHIDIQTKSNPFLSQKDQLVENNAIVLENNDKAINTSNFLIEDNKSFIITTNDTSNQHNKPSDLANLSALAIEATKISSNQINKSELCNTIPHVQHQSQPKSISKQPIASTKHQLIPVSSNQAKPYAYGAFNFEINNKIYLPNVNGLNLPSQGTDLSKQVIKPIDRSSFNDFVNYGSNPLASKPQEAKGQQREDINESSLIIPLNPDSQINDDFNIHVNDQSYLPAKPRSVLFSMEQSLNNNTKDHLHNYRTNLSINSSKDEEDEPSQVNEYDIDKNQKQNESKEMPFSNNHSSQANAVVSSVNLSKLTNFVDMQSKKNFSTHSSNVNINQAQGHAQSQEPTDKKELIKAEIDLFADDASEDQPQQQEKIEDNTFLAAKSLKEQPSPYTLELKQKMTYFDESSLMAKDVAHSNLKHSIVESIKERPIEYDIDDLINPQYLFKKPQLTKKTPDKKQLTKSFCGVTSSKSPIGMNQPIGKSNKRNLSRTNSSIENHLSHLCSEEKGISRSIQSVQPVSLANYPSRKEMTSSKASGKAKNCIRKANSSNHIEGKPSSKATSSYKFKPKKKQPLSNDIASVSQPPHTVESKLQIVPCYKVEISKQIASTNPASNNPTPQLASPVQENKKQFDLDAFSIEVPHTNSSKKAEYSHCMNALVTDSLRIQRQTQEKSRKKILENLAQIVLSQEKSEKELKDKMLNMKLNESQLGESVSSFAVKQECEKELNQFLK